MDASSTLESISAAPPPVMSSDQILNHLDATYKSLPGPVQAALDHAHTLTGGNGTGLAGVATPEPKPQTPIAPAPVSPADAPVPGMTGVHQSDVAAGKLVQDARQKYPFISPNVVMLPKIGNGPYGNESEGWPAGEEGSPDYPRPKGIPLNVPGIEFDPHGNADDLAGEVLHTDPYANGVRDRLAKTFSPDQIKYLSHEALDYGADSGAPDDVKLRNGTDSLIRGALLHQWPQNAVSGMHLTPDQTGMIDNLRQYMATGRQPAAPTPDNTAAPLPLMTRTLPPMGRAISPDEQELNRITAPPIQSGPLAHTKADTGRPGYQQIKNPWLRGLATVGDVIASGVFPRFGAFVPGTSAHHALEVNQAANAVKREQEAQGAEDESALRNAQTEEANANAEAKLNPQPKEEQEGKTVETEHGIMQYNPATHRYDIPVGAAPSKTTAGANVHVLPDGTVIAVNHDAKTGKSTAEVVYRGDPKEAPPKIVQLEKNGKPHQVLVNEKGDELRDLGETGEKPPSVNVNTGTYSLEEDSAGHPVLLNSKTGETKAAPGIQKAGTKEKADAAREKELAPTQDALNYAEDYAQSGRPTGPKDEALMEKYFELAKPSTGFRMSQQQIEMLNKARSMYQGVSATLHHAATGTWFSDKQRAEIIDAMRSLAAAKLKSSGMTGQASPESNSTLPGGITLDEVNAELERRKGGK